MNEFEAVFEQMLQRALRLDHIPPHRKAFCKLLTNWRSINTLIALTGMRRNTINKRLNKMLRRGHVEQRITHNYQLCNRGPQYLWRLK